MITEPDLDQAIAECQAERDPDAWTAMRWAAFLTIKYLQFGHSDRLPQRFPLPSLQGASFAASPDPPEAQRIQYAGKSPFASAIDGKRAADIWPIIDELMSITQALHPEIYNRVMELIQ